MTRPLKKIMLVEDDPDILLITRLSLEVGGGYEVRVCASGTGAVQCAAEYGPDLILLDVMMPGMDGLATMDALRKLPATAAMPVVFFTANTQEQVRQDLQRRGALGVITKPVEPDRLVEQVRAFWQRFACSA
jgi:two-component system, OmpR family, response regulator